MQSQEKALKYYREWLNLSSLQKKKKKKIMDINYPYSKNIDCYFLLEVTRLYSGVPEWKSICIYSVFSFPPKGPILPSHPFGVPWGTQHFPLPGGAGRDPARLAPQHH